jgi:hypothetical protein
VAAVSAATLAASAFSTRLVEGAQHLLQTAFALFQFLACRRLRRKCGLRADDLLPPGGGFLDSLDHGVGAGSRLAGGREFGADRSLSFPL